MSREANATLIGSFVLGAAALFIALILIFGSGAFWSTKQRFVLFFEGSVAGLNIGSPVNYRGVQIGQVTDILVNIDNETLDIRIPVFIEIDASRVTTVGDEKSYGFINDDFLIQALIERGLRAKLQLQSFVTGRLSIELNYLPNTEINLVGYIDKYPELPTIQSDLQVLSETLEKIPLEELMNSAMNTLTSIEEALSSKEFTQSVESLTLTLSALERTTAALEETLPTMITNANNLVTNVDNQLKPITIAANQSLQTLDKTLHQVQQTFVKAEQMIDEDSPLYHELLDAVSEFNSAARSIRSLADYLERNPESLLTGKQR